MQSVEQELAAERSARARAEVAASTGVPAELLSGGTVEELTASAEALLKFRGEQKPAAGSSAIGRIGTTTSPSTPADRFAAALEGKL